MHLGVRSLVLALAASSLSLAAQAQITLPFTINQSASNFTWTGTTSIGSLVGNPSNAFQLTGAQNLDLTFQAGAQPFATGAFSSGGVVATNVSLHGKVLVSIFTVATIDVNNLTLSATSAAFNPGAGGAFSTSVVLTALGGQLVVTPTGGSPTVTDLTGSSSAPTAVNGTLTPVSNALHLSAPLLSTFAFSDPTSGVTGTISLNGTIVGDYAKYQPFCYGDGSGTACPCAAGSAGNGCPNFVFASGAHLAATGLASLTSDTLVLNGTTAPPGPGLYFQGSSPVAGGTVFGNGLLCVGGQTPRLEIRTANGSGSSSTTVGISVQGVVTSSGLRYYQLWYRDGAGFCVGAGYNLSNAVSVLWIP